jgi:hypothetical protein
MMTEKQIRDRIAFLEMQTTKYVNRYPVSDVQTMRVQLATLKFVLNGGA